MASKKKAAVEVDAEVEKSEKDGALALREQAKKFRITSDAEFEQAGKMLVGIAEAKRRAKALFDPICSAQHAAWKVATGKRAEVLDPLEEGDRIIRGEVGKYHERKQRDAQLAAVDMAEAVPQIAALEARGDYGAAAQLSEQVRAGNDAAPKLDGVGFREEWDFEVVDINAVPREYLVIDEHKVGRIVKALRDATSIPGIRAFSKSVPVVGR